jgi:hypothetical protein
VTVAELISILSDYPQDWPVLVAFTPQGCPDDPDSFGSPPLLWRDTTEPTLQDGIESLGVIGGDRAIVISPSAA